MKTKKSQALERIVTLIRNTVRGGESEHHQKRYR